MTSQFKGDPALRVAVAVARLLLIPVAVLDVALGVVDLPRRAWSACRRRCGEPTGHLEHTP